jgi:hypothetical protein
MFCPRCGSTQDDQLKFCKSCGANLFAVRQVVDTRDADKKFDWSNTWLAEMLMTGEEATRLQMEIERRQGITPEVKRYNEIKAGVITGFAGMGVSILLFVLMAGIVAGGNVSPAAAEILSRIWVAGLIPVFVGIALIINGLFVSKKLVELARRNLQGDASLGPGEPEPQMLRAADTSEFLPSNYSVTEGTTKHLRSSDQK